MPDAACSARHFSTEFCVSRWPHDLHTIALPGSTLSQLGHFIFGLWDALGLQKSIRLHQLLHLIHATLNFLPCVAGTFCAFC